MYRVRDLRVKAPCEVARKMVDVGMRCSKVKEDPPADDSLLYATAAAFSCVGRYSRCVHGLGCFVYHDVAHPCTAMR
jgi:hypothetical protein